MYKALLLVFYVCSVLCVHWDQFYRRRSFIYVMFYMCRSLSDLVHALGSQSLGPDTSVQLHWPRHRSAALLQHEHDIVIVDTPGIDIEADFDVWIDNFCLDADLFVWVMNGESTVMMREKKFFRMVKEKIAKPNVLVVINRLVLASGIFF